MRTGPVVLVDNYDSFTYNLAQVALLLELHVTWSSAGRANFHATLVVHALPLVVIEA